jgi:hypothetical protein
MVLTAHCVLVRVGSLSLERAGKGWRETSSLWAQAVRNPQEVESESQARKWGEWTTSTSHIRVQYEHNMWGRAIDGSTYSRRTHHAQAREGILRRGQRGRGAYRRERVGAVSDAAYAGALASEPVVRRCSCADAVSVCWLTSGSGDMPGCRSQIDLEQTRRAKRIADNAVLIRETRPR